ncbi:MAG: hypothetical protein QOF87_3643 [Pseudonocardiales bacterium]|jgi:RNA polymerase sigma-70 factor (ECF subfamily)|nr:hypothetical protein [Pseudonocardiales bacterium]MDT4963996.1 hypothetical protein [Pseudonocardiales bacterium]MDT4977326.1 hypothetical protein [Pseudonocardiales bacterium]MDT4980290.1 hypothetical protein [Pseudonocardiales bacterium]MDT4983011.1 hypothetical protein [Pseudonocardiales bacterium]
MNVDTDADLLERLRQGDEGAFSELVQRYHPRLIRLASSFLSRRDLAEDVAQETWLAVLRGIERFEGRCALRTWLFQICVNRARSIAIRERRVVPVDPASDVGADLFAADGSRVVPPQPWANSIDDAALLAVAQGAILDLPDSQRQVVSLRDVDGLSANEVCHVLSISDANQRVLLHRGRARVRASLRPAVIRAGRRS